MSRFLYILAALVVVCVIAFIPSVERTQADILLITGRPDATALVTPTPKPTPTPDPTVKLP